MTGPQTRIEASVNVGATDGGATGISVGSMGGGGSATVNVNLERLIEEPPQTLREYVKSLWLLTLADQLDRRTRQDETDAHRRALAAAQRAHHRWLVVLTVLVALDTALILILYARLVPLMELWR